MIKKLFLYTLIDLMAERTRHPDYGLLGIILTLTTFGLIVLSSATGPYSYEKFHDSLYLVRHQFLIGVLPGLVGLIIGYWLPLKRLHSFWAYIYLLSLALLILPFVPGIGNTFGTARSWIVIGSWSFQTSELAKLGFILAFSGYAARHENTLREWRYGLLFFFLLVIPPLGILALQPDVGGMAILAFVAIVLFYLGGGSLKSVGVAALIGITAFSLLISMRPYRADRFMVFLHPELDPKGSGYHINQALMAIGSGGLFGFGFGHSRQKFQYLPEVAGDSIFAIIAEELGFIISALLIAVYVWMFLRLVKIAERSGDRFFCLIVGGISALIVGQAFVNIGAMVGLLPLTGLTLPFISYGGSSLFALLLGIGMVLQISKGKEE